MITKIISGGQTGADQAGWRAAKRFGIATGGWMPKGFLTEDGPRPEFAGLYGAQEHPKRDYPSRTTSNIGLSHMTLLFGDQFSPGGKLATRIAKEIDHPIIPIRDRKAASPGYVVVYFIRRQGEANPILNIAGNRESSSPGIGAWVEDYLCEVFRILGFTELI